MVLTATQSAACRGPRRPFRGANVPSGWYTAWPELGGGRESLICGLAGDDLRGCMIGLSPARLPTRIGRAGMERTGSAEDTLRWCPVAGMKFDRKERNTTQKARQATGNNQSERRSRVAHPRREVGGCRRQKERNTGGGARLAHRNVSSRPCPTGWTMSSSFLALLIARCREAVCVGRGSPSSLWVAKRFKATRTTPLVSSPRSGAFRSRGIASVLAT